MVLLTISGWNSRTFTAVTEQNAYGFTVFDGASSSSPDGYQTEYVTAQVQRFVTKAKAKSEGWTLSEAKRVNAPSGAITVVDAGGFMLAFERWRGKRLGVRPLR